METTFVVKNLCDDDISDMMIIHKQAFDKDLQEDAEVFTEIMNIFPEGVFGVFEGDTLAGYLFSHPYFLNQIKPLNSQLNLSGNENCLYLHEIAISPDYIERGLAKKLVERFLFISEKHEFENQSLVSVQDSAEFWRKFGFKHIEEVNTLGYTHGIYMLRSMNSKLT